jgi:sulfate adenylyltransferase large subunit
MPGLLRLCTAGSVDDGKSTLIGRLLYESRGVYEDQVRSVEAASRHRGVGPIDFSLFTDGLKAEREQGITIDVAYRYFATARRTFILADTPGHEQYTRNMATGASTADLAVLLVDARHGIRDQTRRHARIARLLGIASFVLAVNKMDLVGFDEAVFGEITAQFGALFAADDRPADGRLVAHAIPLSALHGDNVTTRSARTPWYDGPTLLPWLETAEAGCAAAEGPFRLPVQLALRPDHRFRGYAGQIASGAIRVGDAVTVWPAGIDTRIRRIVTWDGDLESAIAPMSITLVLDDEVDVGRGDLIAASASPPHVGHRFEAHVVWMDERPLDHGRP